MFRTFFSNELKDAPIFFRVGALCLYNFDTTTATLGKGVLGTNDNGSQQEYGELNLNEAGMRIIRLSGNWV